MATVSRRAFLEASIAGGAVLAISGAGTALADETEAVDQEAANTFVAGTYSASAEGRFGDVVVDIDFDESTILDVRVTAERETSCIAYSALRYIPLAIVEGQTLNVDTVSGSTFTSNAILTAAADCVNQAGGDASALAAAEKAPSSTALVAGTYQATMHGHHSDVVVEVVLGDSSIESVEVVEDGETYHLSDAATSTIPGRVVEAQSTGVDVISGATYTSRAILSCVEDCLEQAGGTEAVRGFGERVHVESSDEHFDLETDVVVVGSGMSGIAAALSAQDEGANVILVEKMDFYGGVSQTSGAYFLTPAEDTDESKEEYYESGINMECGILKGETQDANYPDVDLAHLQAYGALDAISWIVGLGAPITSSGQFTTTAGELVAGYRFSVGDLSYPDVAGAGFEIVMQGFEERGGTVLLGTPATGLLLGDSGEVVGVEASGNGGSYSISCKAVVLAAGGFGQSTAMINKYAPAYNGEFNVTLSGNTGDGIQMGIDAGGAVYDNGAMMGQYGHCVETDDSMIEPYDHVETPYNVLIVNPLGWRVNSESPATYTGGTTYVDPDSSYRDYYWAISTQKILDADEEYAALLQEHLDAGDEDFVKADTLSELARALCITPNTLRYTVNRYNTFCESGVDEDYYKAAEHLVALEEADGPWYATRNELIYFGTIGGLKVNANMEVVDEQGDAIPGLYAAGENANGGFYNLSYIGGRSMTQCLVSGRVAGASAANL